MYVSSGAGLLGLGCLVYWMTLPPAPQQNRVEILAHGKKEDEHEPKKSILLLVGMLSLCVALRVFSETRSLYYGPFTQKYLPQLQARATIRNI